jgi:hypothetical protein
VKAGDGDREGEARTVDGDGRGVGLVAVPPREHPTRLTKV